MEEKVDDDEMMMTFSCLNSWSLSELSQPLNELIGMRNPFGYQLEEKLFDGEIQLFSCEPLLSFPSRCGNPLTTLNGLIDLV